MQPNHTLQHIMTLAALAIVPSQASVIAWDNFDYAAGLYLDEETLNGGGGFTTPWQVREANPLTNTGLIETTGNGFSVEPNGGNIYAMRGFNTLTDGTYYFMFTADNTNDGSRFLAFSLSFHSDLNDPNNGSESFYVGQAGAGSLWGVHGAGFITAPNASTYASRPNADPYLNVLKIEINGSATNRPTQISLFVNPDLSLGEPLTPTVTASKNFNDGINAIWMGSSSTSGSQTTTNSWFGNDLIIATTWADLVPEPSSALLAFVGFTIFTRRQRTL